MEKKLREAKILDWLGTNRMGTLEAYSNKFTVWREIGLVCELRKKVGE